MRQRGKLIVGVLVATMALTGILVRAVSAEEGDDANMPRQQLMERVAATLGVNQQEPENAFRKEIQERQHTRLERMPEERTVSLDRLDECAARWEALSRTCERFEGMRRMRGAVVMERGTMMGERCFSVWCPVPEAAG